MPYLTLWDKISQNLAQLEGNSHKKFKYHRIFRSIYNGFYEEINIYHTLMWFSQAENLMKFCQISLKILHYLTDFSPQLMAYMLILQSLLPFRRPHNNFLLGSHYQFLMICLWSLLHSAWVGAIKSLVTGTTFWYLGMPLRQINSCIDVRKKP